MMKFFRTTALIVSAGLVVLALGCADYYLAVPSKPYSPGSSGAIDLTEYPMVKIAGAQVTVPPGGLENVSADVFAATEDAPLVLGGFSIGEREVPKKLWDEVVGWGISRTNGQKYTFAHGNSAATTTTTTGSASPASGDGDPITHISARDAIVWCNAYSEKMGKKPVYKDTLGQVLRTSDDGTIARTLAAAGPGQSAVDNAVVDPDADGFRLPTVAEWIYVAKGADVQAPAWKHKWMGLADEDITIGWESLNDWGVVSFATKKYAEPVEVTRQVKPIAGTYHMLGNVAEYCWGTDSAYNRTLAVCGWDFDADATDSPDKNPMGILFVDPGDNYPNGNLSVGLRLAQNN